MIMRDLRINVAKVSQVYNASNVELLVKMYIKYSLRRGSTFKLIYFMKCTRCNRLSDTEVGISSK